MICFKVLYPDYWNNELVFSDANQPRYTLAGSRLTLVARILSAVFALPQVFGKIGQPQQNDRQTGDIQRIHLTEKHTGCNHGKNDGQDCSYDKNLQCVQ